MITKRGVFHSKMNDILRLAIVVIVSLFTFSAPLLATGGGGGDPGMPCDDALPFCSDVNYNFPNINNNTYAPPGPNYGCHPGTDLPNPIWYFMEIEVGGVINITISQSTGQNGTGSGLDVDYVMWGPFNDVATGCTQIMNGSANPAQSSWSPNAVEYISIGGTGGSTVNADFTGNCSQAQINAWTQTTLPPAQAGEVYIIIISNWDSQNGYVSFTQTNFGQPGAGSTDCSIVEPCEITNFTSTISPCNNDSYSVTGSITFTDPPEDGDLIVEDCNGNQVIVASAPFTQASYTYELTNLVADGESCEVEAYFTTSVCTETSTYTAPEACSCTEPVLNILPISVCGPGATDLNAAIGVGSDQANTTFYASSANANAGTSPINNMVSSSGTYWVRAEVQGDPTCFSVYEIVVTITTVTSSVLETHPTCQENNGSIEFTASGGEAPYNYAININGTPTQNTSGVFSGLFAGVYNYVIMDVNGCQTSGTVTLSNVGSEADASFSFDEYCAGAANAPYNIVTQGGVFSLVPAPTDGATISPNSGVISNGVGGTTYTVRYTVGVNCPNSSTQQVTVKSSPEPNFEGLNLSGCKPLIVNFSNTSNSSETTCLWNFGDGSTSTSCGDVSHTYTSTGLFDVSLTLTDEIGCEGTLTLIDYVDVVQGPIASFNATPMVTSTENTEITFNNTSTNATDYTWNFGEDSTVEHTFNASHTYPNEQEGSYIVTLVASDGNEECNDTMRVVITIEEELIFYVPNAFTPDGDTYNELFKPIFSAGFDPYGYSLEIYNRWGEIIFESHDVQVGWDGTYGGKIVKEGTYIWKIKIKEKGRDKHNEYQGHTTLLR